VKARIFKAMTIAGSDSGGGAGIQADLKTFAALGVYGTSAITAITAQNTLGVRAVLELPPELVAAQIDAIMSDIGADAAKTGMLANAAIIQTVAAKVVEHRIDRLVVDPVMVAKSGDPLLRPEAVEALKSEIVPLATVITPNAREAEVLCGHPIDTGDDARAAARLIHAMGAKIVVVKGGHLRGDATDLVFDGREFVELWAPRIDTPNTHGTGCTFASAIAAGLAKGLAPLEAIRRAKDYITEALRRSYSVGRGHSPVNHFWAYEDKSEEV
jgi:hydroxymethylpyrimidine/phosphomethylpyrimidine kinase